MTKGKWLLVFILAVTQQLSAQTFDEWFRQNQTQLKYLAAQNAALAAFADDLEDGYQITGQGLSGIASIQGADTAMHGRYFTSLEIVSSAVRADPRVADIRQFCRAVEQLSGLIAAGGTALDGMIAANLEAACAQDLNWLTILLTDGDLALEDSERLRVIGALDANALGRWAFAAELWGDLQGIKK